MPDEAVDVVVDVVSDPDSGELLALRKARSYREANERYQDEPWEFPGGKIEDGETPSAAAVRELAEETGIEGTAVRTGESFTRTHGDTQYRFIPVLVQATDRDAELSAEHDRYRWINGSEINSLVTATEDEAVERIRD